jgi:hypothetical protein
MEKCLLVDFRRFLLSTNEIWKVLVSLAKIFLFIANFLVLGLFIPKKSDVQVGRVNTFHILQTIRNGPSNFKLCMKRKDP